MPGMNVDVTDANAPEVIKAVVQEVKALGDNTKKNYEELNKNYTDMKSMVDDVKGEIKGLDHERLIKLSDDITTRQELLDKQSKDVEKKMNDRMDAIEIVAKRVGKADDKQSVEFAAAKTEFIKSVASVQLNDDNGLTFDRFAKMSMEDNVFKKYLEAYNYFLRKDEKLITPDHYKALQVGSDPDGGYTVTPAMGAKIFERLFESDPVRQLAAVESITTGAIEWLVDWDEADCGWESETVAGDETATSKLYRKRIPVHFMYARPKATQTLIDDSGINVESWLANKVADKFMRTEGAAFITGDGIGKPRGFLTYADGSNYGQIEQVASGDATKVTADGLIDLKYSMIEYYLNRGTFLMSRGTLAKVIKLKDGNGDYLWKPGISSDRESMLLGQGVRMSTSMPAVAASALSIAFADFKEAYMIVDRKGITVQRDPYTKKPFIEFYTRKRVGGDVVNYQAIKIQKISA